MFPVLAVTLVSKQPLSVCVCCLVQYGLVLCIVQFLNYSYLYALNAWLLLNPCWLCFDWSMGCVPVITTFTDARFIIVFLFWFAVMVLLWHVAACSGTAEQRFDHSLSLLQLSVMLQRHSSLLLFVEMKCCQKLVFHQITKFCAE